MPSRLLTVLISPLISRTLPDVPPPTTWVTRISLCTPMSAYPMRFRLRLLPAGSPSLPAESSSSPADRQFASGCSPPHLTMTQLPSATESWLTPTRTCTVLCTRLHGRTGRAVPARSRGDCVGAKFGARAPLPQQHTPVGGGFIKGADMTSTTNSDIAIKKLPVSGAGHKKLPTKQVFLIARRAASGPPANHPAANPPARPGRHTCVPDRRRWPARARCREPADRP